MSDALLSNGHHDSVPDSPAIDSPATPVDNSTADDLKIDVQLNDHEESDVRHDPFPVKLDNASAVPQLSTPIDPSVIPISPPKGTPPPVQGDLLEDVKMAEEPQPPAHPVAVVDAHMAEPGESDQSEQPQPQQLQNPLSPPKTDSPNPSSLPAVSSSTTAVESLAAGSSSPYHNISPNNDDIQPPPAKRARMHSDPDQASLANTATPPPVTPSPPPVAAPSPALNGKPALVQPGPPMSVAQYRFCLSTIRSLKRMKAAGPFLYPVDPVALNIPHYPSVIKHPMDFSTVERKLNSSNPVKPDPNAANPRYTGANEFIADVRLIFANCVTFNGPEHPITVAGKQVEDVFDRQMKNLPPPEEVKPPVVKKQLTPPPPPPPQASAKKLRRQSTASVPVIRRTDEPLNGRPKREIHPPPPKDLPYVDAPKKMRKIKEPKSSVVAEQIKFCDKVLKDLNKKSHYNCAYPFYEPVDWVKLDIPTYPKIVKKPMDMSTMRRKLDANEYTTAEQFHEDFKLMITNCMKFNPAGTPVHVCGQELNRLFYEKWKNLPQPRSNVVSDDEFEEEEEYENDSERDRMIRDMEAQMEAMNRTLAGLKQQKVQKVPKHKEKREKPTPVASTSKATPKANGKKAVANGHKKTTKKPITDDDVLSFEQKKQLSDTIGLLDGVKLEKVIQIIHEGVPEIRDSTEEIELEIDTLPASVLTKLYNFVIRPTRQPPAKRGRTGKGTGTGGLKRKSMDEDVEAEKIRVLEERMALFEKGATASSSAAPSASIPAARGEESDHSSDSSSDDSSGSDSE